MKIDIIGDIHGCFHELQQLTIKLGYKWNKGIPIHPNDRILGFVGDLMDRGPQSLKIIEIVASLVEKKLAFYVPGNHCNKLYRYFLGNAVEIRHGLETTVAELNNLSSKEKSRIKSLFMHLHDSQPLYQILDNGRLIMAHAGIKESYIGKKNKKVKSFVLYGDVDGSVHPDGSPIRKDWAKDYSGDAWIVYGHTPVREARFMHHTVNIDTGCVFGGQLSAVRYPEMEIVSVQSSLPYVEEKFRTYDER